MTDHRVVSHDQWIDARRELLAKEKEFTRLRDELSATRREMPWEKIETAYVFDGSDGKESLADLFDGRSQLIVYHFMYDPDWNEGCKACSFLADHYEPSILHLRHRDVTLVTVSRAPLEKLEAFKKRMGWDFKWMSSLGSDFNWDFGVSFKPEELEAGPVDYNYGKSTFPAAEGPGISVFFRDESDDVFHTYSSYARGLDMFIGAYHLLDIAPKGRDEAEFSYGMEWLRHRDRYGDESFVDPYAEAADG